MNGQPENSTIAGVAILLFFGILVGVGIHHLIATGTCSSTGYSANYGPVPTCPAGTGWWIAFLMAGIVGSIVGTFLVGSVSAMFFTLFGGIGFGSLSLLLDKHTHTSKVFAGIFGGSFALWGVAAGAVAIASGIGSLRDSRKPKSAAGTSGVVKAATRLSMPPGAGSSGAAAAPSMASSAFGAETPPAANAAFGTASDGADAIMSAYHASQASSPSAAASPTPLNLVPGLQAAKTSAAGKDPADELAKLADLHKRGALTDAEFATAKSKLLDQM